MAALRLAKYGRSGGREHILGQRHGSLSVNPRGLVHIVWIAAFDRPTRQVGQVDRIEKFVVCLRQPSGQPMSP